MVLLSPSSPFGLCPHDHKENVEVSESTSSYPYHVVPPSAVTKLNTCPAVDLGLEVISVGALPPFHVIDDGHVIALPNDGYMLFEEAVGSPLAVIVPGFTAPTVVEEVS